MRRLENSLCQPSRKWVPFSIKGRIRQRKKRDGLRLSSAVPKIQDTAPTAIKNKSSARPSGAPVTQWVKRRPTDLADRVRSSLEVKFHP